MRNKTYDVLVKDTSDQTIASLLEIGTVEIVSENQVKLRAKIGKERVIKLCKNVIKIIR